MGSEHPQAGDRSGILAKPRAVMAALLSEIEHGGVGITFGRFCDLGRSLCDPRPNPSRCEPGRVLDTGVEAQVHGPVVLNRDVELLVGDPAFEGTSTGQLLNELADKYGFELQWHCGFRLSVRDVSDDFRGPAMPGFARCVAGASGVLDAARIGQAAASLHHNPEQWSEWGEYHFGRRIER